MKNQIKNLLNSNDTTNVVVACEILKGLAAQGSTKSVVAFVINQANQAKELYELVPETMEDTKTRLFEKLSVLTETLGELIA